MNCLDDYLNIYAQYPKSDPRIKRERHNALINWRVSEADYPLLKTEICGFIRAHSDVINKVFFEKAACPLLDEALKTGDYDFLLDIIEAAHLIEPMSRSVNSILEIYSQYTDYRISPLRIVNEILRHKNSDLLLEYKYEQITEWIAYSIHELPTGILLNEIEVNTRQESADLLLALADLSKKLNKRAAVAPIKTLYSAWFDYLDNLKDYNSFEEYLNKNNIDYEELLNEYYNS